MKRKMAMALAAVLVAGSLPVTASAATFTDINEVSWASSIILSYFIFLIGGSSVILLVPYLYSFCFYIIYFRGYYNIYNCFHHSQCPYHLSMIVLSYSFYNLSFI